MTSNHVSGSALDERAPAYGWARRAVWGGGGTAGRAWRAAATPLAWVWDAAARHRFATEGRRAERLSAPVVSVGNVTVGGGGKTSLVRWLIVHGIPPEKNVAVLTRGTGRTGEGTAVLQPGTAPAAARAAGDEPALLARAGAWVGVGADRVETGRAIARRVDVDVFLLDDGLQHRRVARALDLVTFAFEDLVAPARCLPAGPLRQGPEWIPPMGAWVTAGGDPRDEAWPEGSIADAFSHWWEALPGTAAGWEDRGTVALPAWRDGVDDQLLAEGPAVVFAGVARPRTVAAFARSAGFDVAATIAFPDHHDYRRPDIARLLEDHPEGTFLTTEKDAVKLDPDWFDTRRVGVLRRELAPRDPERVRRLVHRAAGWVA